MLKQLEVAAAPDARLLQSLQTNAPASLAALTARADALEKQVAQLRRLARDVHRRSIETALLRELDQPEAKVDLFHAALLLAKLDNEELDIPAYRRQLDDMAKDITAQLAAMPDDEVKLRALKKFLFEENGFHGSRHDYDNPANSYFNSVMDDREGLPITLSVLFIELARRTGIPGVQGVPLPGHFIAKHVAPDGSEQLYDIFNGGRPLTHSEADEVGASHAGVDRKSTRLNSSHT